MGMVQDLAHCCRPPVGGCPESPKPGTQPVDVDLKYDPAPVLRKMLLLCHLHDMTARLKGTQNLNRHGSPKGTLRRHYSPYALYALTCEFGGMLQAVLVDPAVLSCALGVVRLGLGLLQSTPTGVGSISVPSSTISQRRQ